MLEEFSGDWDIMRVCMASSDPIQVLHNIRTDVYSIKTVLEMIEMLEVRETMREDERVYPSNTKA